MTGIILCGGQSTRMGTDKGLLKLEANTWAQTAVDKIAALQLPVKISVNNQQFADYAEVFAKDDLIADAASLALHGPLLGVLSAHLYLPDQDLMVLACDLPLMEPALLKELYQYHLDNPGYDAYLFDNDGEHEPLCAIYVAKGLLTIDEMRQRGELTRHSMKFMLDHLSVYSIPVKEDQKQYFRNFNAHAELNGL
ncbi:molybdenum cofactor guanylyltransferase [Lacibacter luteus]|uniref:Molybdenum cofactor guanylyltransferase n=1 Tax=Lacibacter luteus TaxID=2508719 RepID=A0A4Q1CL33_9BACT|nr:molybdenum cofactor guanylyltransferase [Lacibacter luteus]RXK61728.1 molybdenum cofactor guanylyltransferase [Lacibacter luteus]